MTAYYNEIDPYAAQWLRNLITEGHIAKGEVDERSIEDVTPAELRGYTQCHFFAGIGGWSYALRLAGWDDSRAVWTGSCPCQPFSTAGKGKGTSDERHLWPAWFHLIREFQPSVVFGEQVEAAINHGWLDLVQTDLEGEGYAFGAYGIPACGVGAPHQRQRLWFVAESQSVRRDKQQSDDSRSTTGTCEGEVKRCAGNGGLDAMADPAQQRRGETGSSSGRPPQRSDNCGEYGSLGNTDGIGETTQRIIPTGTGTYREGSMWDAADWIYCRDHKYRPVEPGTFPLAHGVSNRVGRLRAYGNAIVPQVAAEVIKAYMECQPCK